MDQFLIWLDQQATDLRTESRRLVSDDRRDDGDLVKIRANVYGICKSVLQVLDLNAAKGKLAELRDNWNGKLAVARAHDDRKQAAIEEIKLETLLTIQAALEGV